MELPLNCGNCAYFDGECFCALRHSDQIIRGFIAEAEAVVCVKHTTPEALDDQLSNAGEAQSQRRLEP